MELDRFDLNLLLSLNALLEVRHVSQAADSMALTQSGMSKNLAKLRDHFQDDLLVRAGNRMVLTPKAESLINPVKQVIFTLDAILLPDQFNPATTPMRFTIAAADFLMQLYFPGFLGAILKQAPQLSLNLVAWSGSTLQDLERGSVDFLLGALSAAPAGIYRKVLNRSHYVCVTRKGHPAFTNGFEMSAYLDAGHVSISMFGTGSNPVDDWLAEHKLKRTVVVTTPYFMSGIAMVSQSDLVMIAHAGLAEQACQHYDLNVFKLPLELAMPPFGIYWHERTKASPAHLWFRDQVAQSVGMS